MCSVFKGFSVLMGLVIMTGAAVAGGLSQDVAREAMCEDYLAWCVAEPVPVPICEAEPEGVDCLVARINRDATCLDRYELCLSGTLNGDT